MHFDLRGSRKSRSTIGTNMSEVECRQTGRREPSTEEMYLKSIWTPEGITISWIYTILRDKEKHEPDRVTVSLKGTMGLGV